MNGARVGGWIAAPAATLIVFALPLPDWAIESFYSQGIYRWWQGWITALSNLAPFAVLDLFLIGAVILVLWRIARLFRVMRTAGIVAAVWEGFRRVSRAAGVVALLFLLFWGLNYRRVAVDASMPATATPSVDDLRAVIADADALGARLRPPPVNDAPAFNAVTTMLREPLNDALVSLHRTPLVTPGRPKFSLVLTPFFTWAGVDGMVNPFALESVLHPDLLPFERPFAVAHEWAHLSGTADEAEASAIGWLACMRGAPELAYSANIYLIAEAGSALPPTVWRQVLPKLDAGIRADLASLAERQQRQRPDVQRTAFKVYDQYLRVNRVEDGVASYSRALTLILSPPFKDALSSYRFDRGR